MTLHIKLGELGKRNTSEGYGDQAWVSASLDPSINDFTLQVWTAGGGKSFARLRDLVTSITKPIHSLLNT